MPKGFSCASREKYTRCCQWPKTYCRGPPKGPENRIDAEPENISGARRLYSHVSQGEDLSFWPGGEREDGAEGDDEASFGMLFDYYVVATHIILVYLYFF